MNDIEALAEIQGEIAECRRVAGAAPTHPSLRWMFLLLAHDLERWARMADQHWLDRIDNDRS